MLNVLFLSFLSDSQCNLTLIRDFKILSVRVGGGGGGALR